MSWQEILKVQPLLDTRKLSNVLGFSEGPIDLMYEYRRGAYGPPKKLMILGEEEGDMNEEYEMTKIQLTGVNVEGKKMVVEGEYTLEKLGDFTFQAIYTFDKKLVVMSSLPRLDHRKLTIITDDKFRKLTQNNSYGINRDFRQLIGQVVFGFLFDSFDNIEEYASDYLPTGPRLSRDKDLEGDKRGKQERFKEVLRKPDSSNVREFSELVNDERREATVLPLNDKIVNQLVKRGFFEYDESALERNTFPYKDTKKKENIEVDGVPINLYFQESMVKGDASITIKDIEGEYEVSLYAYPNLPYEIGNRTSKERQKLIDANKAFKKMTGKQILTEILRM